MNAGIIGILTHQLQYQFSGLQVISTVAFLIDFVLFIIFSLIFLARFAIHGRQAYQEITSNVPELALTACWPIAWLTLVSFVSLIVSQASWGAHAFTIVAYVMWWIGAAWMMATLLFVIFTLIRRHSVQDHDLPPLICIPAVGVATLAAVGGLVSSFSHDISARLAVPVIISSFCAVGIGLFFALFFYTYLFHTLLKNGWPPVEQIGSMFVFVGPMGQSAAALQLLGSAADTYSQFAGYHKGTFLQRASAAPLDVACILIALLLTGMSAVWLLVALCAMAELAYKRQLKWSLSWNAIVFPTGTLATSTLQLGIEMDSPFVRVITAIILIFIIIVFLFNLCFTVFEIAKGKVLIVTNDTRIEKEK